MPDLNDYNGFIVAAYAITWITFIAYALRLAGVMRRSREQLRQASRGAGGES